jgi:hypothetical protein
LGYVDGRLEEATASRLARRKGAPISRRPFWDLLWFFLFGVLFVPAGWRLERGGSTLRYPLYARNACSLPVSASAAAGPRRVTSFASSITTSSVAATAVATTQSAAVSGTVWNAVCSTGR